MDTFNYKGKTYKRYSSKWLDINNLIVCDSLQTMLNMEFVKNMDVSHLETNELISNGDKFKASYSYYLAIKYYEAAVEKSSMQETSYILPRLASCYRKINQPLKVIKIATYAKQNFGSKLLTAPLLTSTAAAYCDLGEYSNAKKCCDLAYAMLGGAANEELNLVYKRLKKEM